MQDIVPFLIQHWTLSLAFVVVLGVIIYEERKSGGGRLAVNITAAVNLINREKALVLDLRPADQFKEGHIVDALNIPMLDLESKLKTLEKYQQRHVLIVCPFNKSATSVLTKFHKAGFGKAQLLAGGVEAWKKADLPLVKS